MDTFFAIVIFIGLPVYFAFVRKTGWTPGSTPAERAKRLKESSEKLDAFKVSNDAYWADVRKRKAAKAARRNKGGFGHDVGEAIGGAVVLGTAAAAYEAWKHRRRS